jgi:hypothetical protein
MGFIWITDDRGVNAGMSNSGLPDIPSPDEMRSSPPEPAAATHSGQFSRHTGRVTLADRIARLFNR